MRHDRFWIQTALTFHSPHDDGDDDDDNFTFEKSEQIAYNNCKVLPSSDL